MERSIKLNNRVIKQLSYSLRETWLTDLSPQFPELTKSVTPNFFPASRTKEQHHPEPMQSSSHP